MSIKKQITNTALEYQIKAIQRNIESGKSKNKYAAEAKVRQLKKILLNRLQSEGWQNYLAQ